jgi:hypothetical protein
MKVRGTIVSEMNLAMNSLHPVSNRDGDTTLRKQHRDSLTLTIEFENNGVGHTSIAIAKQLISLIPVVIQEKDDRKTRALIEALTPDVEFSPNRIQEARMMGQARAAILQAGDFVRAADIADAAHFSAKNPSSQPNRWKRNGQIFAIHYKGTDLYPAYALDDKASLKPLPIVAEILKLFPDKDGWQIAFWFASINGYLNDKAPKDLLNSRPKDVLSAAEIESAGILHG